MYQSFLEGIKNTHERQSVEQTLKDRPSETAQEGDPFHIQSPNPNTIVDAKQCLLTGAWYNCLQRNSTRAQETQRWMLIDNPCIEHWFANDRVRERTEGAERGFKPIGRTTIASNQIPQNSHGLEKKIKSTHGENHGSNCKWSREWLCRTSMGGYVLGPVKTWYPSVMSVCWSYSGWLWEGTPS